MIIERITPPAAPPKKKLNLVPLFSILVCVLAAAWFLIRLPAPMQFLLDQDGGHQLAGASQILAGEHPFIDYEATYGPLTFYASALAQKILGRRAISEILLLLGGFIFGYLLLFRLSCRASGNAWIGLLITLFALAAMPRLYKYYLLACPMLVLWAVWNWMDRPGTRRMLFLAAAVTVTGLYRADFGAYSALAGAAAVGLTTQGKAASRLRQVARLLLMILAFALPWLAFLLLNGGLPAYFRDMTAGGINIALGMSVPLPGFSASEEFLSQNNLKFIVSRFFLLLPVLTALAGFLSRQFSPDWKKILVACLLGQLCLLQSIHRADILHLLQGIPVGFVLLAWLVKASLRAFRVCVESWQPLRFLGFLSLTAVLLFNASIPALLIPHSTWTSMDPAKTWKNLQTYSLPIRYFLEELEGDNAGSWEIQAIQYIRRCTLPGQRVLALPIFTYFPYYTDRRFGGGQIGLVSGYFSTEADQRRMISRMQSQDIPLVVFQPDLVFDQMEERMLEKSSPLVVEFIREKYTEMMRLGPVSLMLRRDLHMPQENPSSLSDAPCPFP